MFKKIFSKIFSKIPHISKILRVAARDIPGIAALAFSSTAAFVIVEEETFGMLHHYTMERPIYKLISKGNMPNVKSLKVMIDIELQKQEIHSFLMDNKERFGVIIGPIGTGKSSIMRHITREHNSSLYKNKEKIVYHEVRNPDEFGYELARVLNVPTSVHGFKWLLETVYLGAYFHVELIKHDKDANLNNIQRVLDHFQSLLEKSNQSCVLVLDGVDLIAKADPPAFVRLVQKAKLLTSSSNLKMVFVSSEGHVIPLIREGGITRAQRLYEVTDRNEAEGKKYLSDRGVPQRVLDEMWPIIGSRMIFLEDVAFIFKDCQVLFKDEDEIIQIMKDHFYSRYFVPGMWKISQIGHEKCEPLWKNYIRRMF